MGGRGDVGPLPGTQVKTPDTVCKEDPAVPNDTSDTNDISKSDKSTPRCIQFGLRFAREDIEIPNEGESSNPLTRKCSASSDESSKVTSRAQTPRGRSLIPEKKKGKRSQTPFSRCRVNIYESDSDEDSSPHTCSKTNRVRFSGPSSGEGKNETTQTEGKGGSDATGSGTSVASENTASSSSLSSPLSRGRSRVPSKKPAKRSQTPFSHRRINLDDIKDDDEPCEDLHSTEESLDTFKQRSDNSEGLESSSVSGISFEGGSKSYAGKPNSSTLMSIVEDKGSLKKGERNSRRRISFCKDLKTKETGGKELRKTTGTRHRISFAAENELQSASRVASQKDENTPRTSLSSVAFNILPGGSRSCPSKAPASEIPKNGGGSNRSGCPRGQGRRSFVTFEDPAVKSEGGRGGGKCVKFAEESVAFVQQRGRTMKRERGKRSATPFARPRIHATESVEVDEHEEESFGSGDAVETAVADRKTVSFDWASLAKARDELYGEDATGGEDSIDEERACHTLPSMGRRGRSRTTRARGAIKRSPTPFARGKIDIYAEDCDEKADNAPCMVKKVSTAGSERDARRGRMSFGSRVSSFQSVNHFMTSEEEDGGYGGGHGKRNGKASDVWRTMSRVTETTMPSSDSDSGTFEKGTQTDFGQEIGVQTKCVGPQAAMEAGVRTYVKKQRFWNWFGGTGGVLLQGFLIGFGSAMLEN